MRDEFTLFKDIIIIATPFLLALMAYLNKKRDKQILEDQKYKDKYFQGIEVKRLEDETMRDRAIEEIRKDVVTLSGQMIKFEESVDMVEISKVLNKLLDINAINMEYSQSLSRVVVSIGESLKKSDSSGSENIAKVIEAHLQAERDLTNKIYKSIY